MIIADMHTHSENSHDSRANILKNADFAYNNGIDIFAVTDHADIQFYNERNIYNAIKNSVKEAKEANEKYKGKVKVLHGVELGESIWSMHYTREILDSNEFDVVLLSVHDLRTRKILLPFSNFDFTALTRDELFDFINRYFEYLLLSLKSVKCDVCAHLTLPFRYINNKCKLNLSTRLFEDKITEILNYLIENNIALEVNVSKSNGGMIPEEWIFEKYKALGGCLITIGSDAHVTENLGCGILETAKLLKNMGFGNYYYYEKRKPIAIKL